MKIGGANVQSGTFQAFPSPLTAATGNMIYRFEGYELDNELFELSQDGKSVKVEPQVFSLLELLVTNCNRVVTKEEINETVWGGRIVSDAALNSRVKSLRHALGDDGKRQKIIKTVHGRGFRFVANVEKSLPTKWTDTAEELPDGQPEPNQADRRPSIAVLPLQLLSDPREHAGLGDAVSQEIIVELCRLHWLHVIARGSSFRLRAPDVDLHEAGLLLGVSYILTGTISVFGDTAIVTVELLNMPDSRVVWAERFQRPLDEMLELRLTISAHIVASVESHIQTNEAENTFRYQTENFDAWSAYHRGLWHMFRFNPHDNDVAESMFQRAISLDGKFARAYAGLSFVGFTRSFRKYDKDPEANREAARKHAERALELDATDPFCHLVKGRSEWLEGDISSAVSWLDRSIELNPNFATALYSNALLNAILCNGERGEEVISKAIELSPIDPFIQSMFAARALSAFVRGDAENALSWSDRSMRAPNLHPHACSIAALVYSTSGKIADAQRCLAMIQDQDPNFKRSDFLEKFGFTEPDTLKAAIGGFNLIGFN